MKQLNEMIKKALPSKIKEETEFSKYGQPLVGWVEEIHGFGCEVSQAQYNSMPGSPVVNVEGTLCSDCLRIAKPSSGDLEGYEVNTYVVINNKFTATVVDDRVEVIEIESPIKLA